VLIRPPDVVERKAQLEGEAGRAWLAALPETFARLCREWDLTFERVLEGGTEALVAAVTHASGTPAIVKLLVPPPDRARLQRRMLTLGRGRGYVELLAHDEATGAMLLERLGPQLVTLGLPVDEQIRHTCAVLRETWRIECDGDGFMSGAEKAEWLAAFITEKWPALERPCSRRVVDRALGYADVRRASFDPRTCVLAHGDAHAWNTLLASPPAATPMTFKLVDPDGLFVEPAYDLAIPMREWGAELLAGDPLALGRARCALLARLTGVDPQAIWEWGFIERVSSGLLLLELGEVDVAREFLSVAEAWAG
jgi:streptomycin 6-kinase